MAPKRTTSNGGHQNVSGARPQTHFFLGDSPLPPAHYKYGNCVPLAQKLVLTLLSVGFTQVYLKLKDN